LAKSKGATIYGICNVVGSTIARMTDAGSYIHAGPEIGVASTKAFTGQIAILILFALQLAKNLGTIESEYMTRIVTDLSRIGKLVEEVLNLNEKVREIAKLWKDSTNALYLGRGYLFPVALEGALKLKEISYIHAEGYPAAEMKHGPIALIDENMPVVFIANNDSTRDKVVSNIQEVKARGGKILAIVKSGDVEIEKMVDWVIEIPQVEEVVSPLLSVIPLQLLAYYIAVERGCNVDQPRNLAKSVTVE
jgi:glucosamine--fructose-6-phosphate aminotransferase (isomerizing)